MNNLNLDRSKTYNVVITGIQQHIKGQTHKNISANYVQLLIDKMHDVDYPMPIADGNPYELNGDCNIEITEYVYKDKFDVCFENS